MCVCVRVQVVFTSPTAMQRVLVSNVRNYEKPVMPRRMLKRITGESLLTTEGDVHARQRSTISPGEVGAYVLAQLCLLCVRGVFCCSEKRITSPLPQPSMRSNLPRLCPSSRSMRSSCAAWGVGVRMHRHTYEFATARALTV